jgi:hypothetical protein
LQNSLLLYQPPDLPEISSPSPPFLISTPIISIPLFSSLLTLVHYISGGEDNNLPKPCYHKYLPPPPECTVLSPLLSLSQAPMEGERRSSREAGKSYV